MSVGDREFRSVELAYWLKQKPVYFALRQKQDTYLKISGNSPQKLSEIGLTPGMNLFLPGINYTKNQGFGQFSLLAYWKRKYRGKGEKEGWYILTNLSSAEEVIEVYKARSGIEALFKDCKTGGYNLEGSKASIERLTRLVLLIAMAYTLASLKGHKTQRQGQQKYISRLEDWKRSEKRHSHFWTGLYGFMWTIAWDFCRTLVEKLISLSLNKLLYFQQGMRAMCLIQLFN